MELTSDALVNSLLALGAAALLATLWLWPRLARQRPCRCSAGSDS
ncbi:hypothetical protein ACFQ0M_27290 [Kitasatospora aburaviensis]